VLDEQERTIIYRTQMDVVLPSGMAILNADDDRVVDLARFCDGQITFFTKQAKLPVLTEHLQRGGRAVFIDHNQLIMAHGTQRINLCDAAAIPVTEQATNIAQIYNVMAAAAGAWALGLSPDLIEAGLVSFVAD
jgi:cyanophycin synthetase